MKPRSSFRAALQQHKPLVTPAAHDALSARLIENAGFPAFSISGSGLIASRYGLPDLGLVGLADMVAGARDILAATSLPCSADIDDGYGDAKSVHRAVRLYDDIGMGGVTLEDQSGAVKRPGEGASDIVPVSEYLSKLKAALAARSDGDMMIVARTDALLVAGLDEAMRRAEQYFAAGADGVFIAGLKNEKDIEAVGRAFKGQYLPIVISDISGAAGPTAPQIYDLGFGRITIPSLVAMAATAAMTDSLSQLASFAAGTAARPKLADADAAKLAFRTAVQQSEWERRGG